ncbi:MAG: hypothetical protein R2788_24265 [Saprospiraceae bacterium]
MQVRPLLTMQQRRSDMNLQAVHDELTAYFYCRNAAAGAGTILTHQTMSKQVYDLKLLDEVLALVEAGGYEGGDGGDGVLPCFSGLVWQFGSRQFDSSAVKGR